MWVKLALVGLALNLARLLVGGGCKVETASTAFPLPSKFSFAQNELRHQSRLFQQLVARSQAQCTSLPATKLVTFSNSTVLQKAYFAAVLLLESIAGDNQDALAVETSLYFLPLSPCQSSQQQLVVIAPRVLSTSEKLNLVDKLHLQFGAPHTAATITNWQFFIREALRYVTRPTKLLHNAIDGLKYPKPFAGWEPYKYAASRVCIYFPPQGKSKLLGRVVKGLEIYVYSHSGIGMEQAILFPRQDRGLASQLAKELNRNGTLSQQDLKHRRVQPQVPIAVLLDSNTSSELSLLAHAFVFAECDLVVADYSQSFPRFVHLLSTAFRYAHNQFPAYYDLTSNHYDEEL